MYILISTIIYIIVTVTGYAPSAGGINSWGDGSVTYSGMPPGPLVAGCGKGWELGTHIYIPGRGKVVCGDRGAIGLYDIDLWFPSERMALEWGVRKLPVIVIDNRERGMVE